MDTIKLLLVDDHSLIRAGILNLLKENPQFEIVGEAENGEDAILKIAHLRPDVVLLDISLPDISGIEVIKYIYEKKKLHRIRFLLISMFDTEEYYYRAVKAGASGLIGKNISRDVLYKGILLVSKGMRYFGENLSEKTVEAIIGKLDSIRFQEHDPENIYLTKREINVLAGLTLGQVNKEIAGALSISIRTVETYRENLMQKFRVASIQELLAKLNSSEKQRRTVQESAKALFPPGGGALQETE